MFKLLWEDIEYNYNEEEGEGDVGISGVHLNQPSPSTFKPMGLFVGVEGGSWGCVSYIFLQECKCMCV